MTKRLIYICSPYRGDVENNVEAAREYCARVILNYPGVIPVAPHLYFPQFLNDDDSAERALGMESALALLESCAEVWVYGEPTEGMKAEIDHAILQGIPVKRRRALLDDWGEVIGS